MIVTKQVETVCCPIMIAHFDPGASSAPRRPHCNNRQPAFPLSYFKGQRCGAIQRPKLEIVPPVAYDGPSRWSYLSGQILPAALPVNIQDVISRFRLAHLACAGLPIRRRTGSPGRRQGHRRVIVG